MQYELYIDVFILVNFMMDYMILAVTDKILHCHSSGKRRCLGALIGAVLTCAVLLIPVPYAFVKFILFHGFVNIVMIKSGKISENNRPNYLAFTSFPKCLRNHKQIIQFV